VAGSPERRATARIQVSLDLTLERTHGSEIRASTIDLAERGARIATTRPLRVDEVLTFHLGLRPPDTELDGRVRVLREHPNHVYAIRFEELDGDGRGDLSAFVARQQVAAAAGGRYPSRAE
jgi:hypothetical protein